MALPLIRLATGGPGWPAAIAAEQLSIVAVDLAMWVGGGWSLWSLLAPRRHRVEAEDLALQPAE